MSEKHDWRLVAVALASVVRPLSHEDELRRGWDAATEKARLAAADAETELQRAEQYARKCAKLMEEIDALTVRLEAAEAARVQAGTKALQTYTQMDAEATRDRFQAVQARREAVPGAGPEHNAYWEETLHIEQEAISGQATEENGRLRSQVNVLYAELNALREKQLDTQARCDKAIQARIEAQRERAAAERARDETAVLLGRASAANAEYAGQIKTLRSDLEQSERGRAALASDLEIIDNSWLIGDLREQLAAMTAARDAARKELVDERAEVARLREECRELAEELTNARFTTTP